MERILLERNWCFSFFSCRTQ